jgi:hypothetical protein
LARDEGLSWETIAVGRPTPTVDLDPREFPGLERVRVRVVATDGFENSPVSETDVSIK